eukprot:TRINITY_DN10976_c0_g1_i1.p1 TRINITY_DN10976_c0_g1~~TRINITY_DN10976_c0_g1_i1.p1  ORF type:complete len:1209 (+),score=144.56 TRINITY_DN10976_c0_g1_i1:32-3628(+)
MYPPARERHQRHHAQPRYNEYEFEEFDEDELPPPHVALGAPYGRGPRPHGPEYPEQVALDFESDEEYDDEYDIPPMRPGWPPQRPPRELIPVQTPPRHPAFFESELAYPEEFSPQAPPSIFGDTPPEGSFESHYYIKYGGRGNTKKRFPHSGRISVTNLRALSSRRDEFGHSELFVVVQTTHDRYISGPRRVNNAEWNRLCSFPISVSRRRGTPKDSLEVELWERDHVREDKILQGKIDLSDVRYGGYEIEKAIETPRGAVFLRLALAPEQSARRQSPARQHAPPAQPPHPARPSPPKPAVDLRNLSDFPQYEGPGLPEGESFYTGAFAKEPREDNKHQAAVERELQELHQELAALRLQLDRREARQSSPSPVPPQLNTYSNGQPPPASQPQPASLRPGDRGAIRVTLLSATGLPKADVIGKADPFVTLRIRDQNRTSRVLNNTQEPVWNERFDFFVNLGPQQVPNDMLEIALFDKEFVGKTALGTAALPLDFVTRKNDIVTRDVTLRGKDGPAGTVHLTFQALDFPSPVPPAPAPAPLPAVPIVQPYNGTAARQDPLVDQLRAELASLQSQMSELQRMNNNSIVPLQVELNTLRAQIERANVLLERSKHHQGEPPLHTFGLRPSTIRRSARSEDGDSSEAHNLPFPGSSVHSSPARPQQPLSIPQYGAPPQLPNAPEPRAAHPLHQESITHVDPRTVPPDMYPELGPVTVEERHYVNNQPVPTGQRIPQGVPFPQYSERTLPPPPPYPAEMPQYAQPQFSQPQYAQPQGEVFIPGEPAIHPEFGQVFVEERRYGPVSHPPPREVYTEAYQPQPVYVHQDNFAYQPEYHVVSQAAPPYGLPVDDPLPVDAVANRQYHPPAGYRLAGQPVMQLGNGFTQEVTYPYVPQLMEEVFQPVEQPRVFTSERYVPAEQIIPEPLSSVPTAVVIPTNDVFVQEAAVPAQATVMIRELLPDGTYRIIQPETPVTDYTDEWMQHQEAAGSYHVPEAVSTTTYATSSAVLSNSEAFASGVFSSSVDTAQPRTYYIDPRTGEELSEAEFARRYAGTAMGHIVGVGGSAPIPRVSEAELASVPVTTTAANHLEEETDFLAPEPEPHPPVASLDWAIRQPTPLRTPQEIPKPYRDGSPAPKPGAKRAAFDHVKSRVFEKPKPAPKAKPAKPSAKRGKSPGSRQSNRVPETPPEPNLTTPQPAAFVMESEQF